MKYDLETTEQIITDNSKKTENSDSLNKVLANREKMFLAKRSRIQFAEPILKFNGIGTIYKNSITIIQGKSGSHKSRFSETLIQELLKKNENILLVDTERNTEEHLPLVIQNLQRSFGVPFTEDLKNFDCISMIGVHRNERIKTIEDYIRLNNFKGIIVIDVVSDIVVDFNNSSETQEFFDKANDLISQLNVSFLLVIHENPSLNDKKARGHLGTESRNKASVTISISSVKDNKLKIEYLKTRHEKLPEPFLMCYDEGTKLLKRCSENYDETEDQIDNVIQSCFSKISKAELYKKIGEIINRSDARSINKRINKYFTVPFALHGKEYILKENGVGAKQRDIVYVEYQNNK